MSGETNGQIQVSDAMQGILCEGCGYSLATILNSDCCPECGTSMAASMPSRRVGTAWQREGWWAGLKEFVRKPVSTLKQARQWDEQDGLIELKNLTLAAGLYATLLMPMAWTLTRSERPLDRLGLTSILFLVIFLLGWMGLLCACTFERWGLRRVAQFHAWRLGREQSQTLSAHASFAWPLGMVTGLAASLLMWTGWLLPSGYEFFAVVLGPGLGLVGYEAVGYFGLRQNRYANW